MHTHFKAVSGKCYNRTAAAVAAAANPHGRSLFVVGQIPISRQRIRMKFSKEIKPTMDEMCSTCFVRTNERVTSV